MAQPPPSTQMYLPIIQHIFQSHFMPGATSFNFKRAEIGQAAQALGIPLAPKNFGDLVYTFRYRADLPPQITTTAPPGEVWVILPAGKSVYSFTLLIAPSAYVTPNPMLSIVKVPDSTPGLVTTYRQSDEQALLAKIRYNRLLDIFTGVTCYSLQNHLRTTIPAMGQIETDEIYVGIDQRGAHHFFPVQAKGDADRIGLVQIYQDFALCEEKYPALNGHPIAAQFMEQDLIVLFTFERQGRQFSIAREKHYRLVPPDQISAEDLALYRQGIFEAI